MRKVVTTQLRFSQRSQASRRQNARGIPLRFEGLEERRLLSANQIQFDDATSSILIHGSEVSDIATVSVDSTGDVRVQLQTADGYYNTTFPGAAVTSVRFFGGNGDDTLWNYSNVPSQAWGDAGNDKLNGSPGYDLLVGGSGDDQLDGEEGDDDLRGELGNDLIQGRAGNDLLAGGAGDDELLGGTGNDQLKGLDGNDKLRGEEGDDGLWGNGGNDELIGALGNDYLNGGDGDDTLRGEIGNDRLYGYGGNDLLFGWNGNDELVGGAGNDRLYGGLDNDRLHGEDGADEIFGEEGNDQLAGNNGNDSLSGGIGDDFIAGGFGNDHLDGAEGNDELIGEEGDDLLSGGVGDDVLIGGSENDKLLGGFGEDRLNGEEGNDELFGEEDNDWLSGWDGDDLLGGGNGNDYLTGGDGNDHLNGDDGDDELLGDGGEDWISGWNGNDTLSGGSGNDFVTGGIGDDHLNGEEGNDELYGEEDNDWLSGWDGDDLLGGGNGNDYVTGGDGNDHINGDDGEDELLGDGGEDWISGWNGNDTLSGGSGNDFLTGGIGDDHLNGEEGDDALRGEEGDDWLSGWNGIDDLVGAVGNDFLIGGFGDDRLSGDEGNDSLYGAEGNDWISGWKGNDELDGGLGQDYLTGGDEGDWLHGGGENDQLYGDLGNDWLWGMDGNDVFFGGEGDDFLIGGRGDDSLNGALGNDLLDGGAGADRLVAGDGNDVLIGGLDRDELLGDNGEDLILGGATAYEDDVQKLWALMGAWSSTAPYATRIASIENEVFSARLQSQETVFDDAVADALFGGGWNDWFLLTGHMPAYRPEEVIVHDHSAHGHGDHHAGPTVVHEPPALEGFEFIDSLDTLSDRQGGEKVHSLVPHAENLVLQREHLSLFELVRYDQVTHIAVRNGAWSDPATWQNGILPTSGARVLVPVGVEIRVDGMLAARVSTIRVDGTLSFDTARNTELKADTIVVSSSGTFQMGTEAQPIASSVQAMVTFTNNGEIDRQWDPFGISRGLVSHGRVSIYGSQTNSHAAISGPLPVGTQMLVLKSVPVGWKPGDTVIVASTNGPSENEARTIASIAGNVVVLDQPLAYSHSTPAANLDVHIANTTRNAIFRSEGFASDRRGHVMFMHNRDVHVANAGFYRLGRTNKAEVINDPVVGSDWVLQDGTGTNPRARYPVHFHRNGLTNDGQPTTIRGSAVVDSPGWGFVNHSSYVDMTDNVAFNVFGAAFATEVGDEIGGFYGNIALGIRGSGEADDSRETKFQDFGHQGDGFWFQGAGVSVVGNVSAGNQGHAFAYYTRGLIESTGRGVFLTANLSDPSIANGAPVIDVGQVPVVNFRDNIGYASYNGLRIRYHLENSTHGKTSLFENSQFWNNTVGIVTYFAQNIVLRNLQVIRTPDGKHWPGLDSHIVDSNITYDNLAVIGYHIGIILPRWGNNVVRGGVFQNAWHDIYIPTAIWRDRTVLLTGLTGMPKINLVDDLAPFANNSAELFFIHDSVILDFGVFENQQAFYSRQQADSVPFPTARPDVPAEYVGLTNQQLWDRFGKALSGQIAPSDTFAAPNIVGALIERL